jgi:hypothetical protein
MTANLHSLSADHLAKRAAMAPLSAAALRAAVEEKNLPAVQACLGQLPAQQAAVAAKTQGLLLQAAERGFVACVQWLLQSEYGGVDDAEPLSGCSALHRAAAVNQAACVATLLAAGAAPNSRDALQRTPLHLAVAAGAVDSVVVLLKAGADLLALDDMERSAADMLAAAEAGTDDSGLHGEGAAAAAACSSAALHGDALQVISALLVKELQSAVDAIRAAGMEVPPALLKALEAAATGGSAGSGAGAADAALAAATLRAAELTASVAGPAGGGSAAAGVGGASTGLVGAAPSRRLPWSVSNRLGGAGATGAGADAGGIGGGLRRVNTLRDVAEATGDGEAPISGIMDVDVLLALLVTKFQASVDQGLVADYSEIYRVLDSAGDNRCSAGDLASGCLEMGIDIAPELLPAVLERMTGREGAETMTCDEFTAFCDVAAEAAAAVAAAGDGDEERAGDRPGTDEAGDAKEGDDEEEVIALPRSA